MIKIIGPLHAEKEKQANEIPGKEMNKKIIGKGIELIANAGFHSHQFLFKNGKSVFIIGKIINCKSLNQKEGFDYDSQEEFLIQFYEKYAFEKLHELKGHFLLFLFDAEKQKIGIATDHFGSFPFYYSKENGNIILSTKLKTIFDLNLREKVLNKSAISDFFVYRYIPAPKTIWQNIYKIPAATLLEIDCENLEITEKIYWDIQLDNAKMQNENPVEYFDKLLQESILNHAGDNKNQASFLSGGYDSSAIVYYLKKMHFNVSSFSLGFENWEKSEDYYAEKVAKHLKIANEKQILDENSLNYIDKMPDVYEEPLADISIIPSFIAGAMASGKTHTIFSGEGADEILAGYHWQKEYYERVFPKNWRAKLKKLFKGKEDILDFYAQAMGMGYFDKINLKELLQENYYNAIPDDVHWHYKKHYKKDWEPLKAMQYLDMKCFMGALVLPKITFATRANNLQIAMPFLDPDMYNYVFNLPIKEYFKRNQSKFLLYENIKEGLPMEVLQRKKQGFVGPDAYYMQVEWYKKQFKNSKLVALNIIKQSFIDKMLEEDYNWKLWKILVLEKWAQKWL